MKVAPDNSNCGGHLVDFLDYAGSEGWELCAATTGATDLGHVEQYVFKRPLP